ncbi:hypothetical protein Ddye_022778 [Dipteronia dyeriana]|uniref:Uncharacterized protein n=1 Tax=Dipteronia dyeriana TaxID=168575 RepID=A0AAD9TRQ4_9ROSI|nr:hypothetical protein Ddye_022778 [Dipteronia dyeriana]
MNSANVIDLSMQGMAHTWFNNREFESWARLDRFLCDPMILSWFPHLVQKGLCKSLSDHNLVHFGDFGVDWGPKPFRFFNGWLEDKDLMVEVHKCWSSCSRKAHVGSSIKFKLKAIKAHLKSYIKTRRVVGNSTKILEDELAREQCSCS